MKHFGPAFSCLLALHSPTLAQDHANDCIIQPWREVKLSTATGGLLREVLAEVGDRVSAGMVVARLESGQQEQALRMAELRMGASAGLEALRRQKELLEDRVSRQHALNDQALVADEKREETDMEMARLEANLAEAELTRDTAAIELAQARLQLQGREVVSPLNGVVVDRSLSPGEYLSEGAHVLTVSQMDPLRVVAWAPVASYGSIAIGARVTVTPEITGAPPVEAKITAIPPIVDLGSGTYTLIVSLPNPDGKLPAGTRCQFHLQPS